MTGQDFTARVSPDWAYLTYDGVDDTVTGGDVLSYEYTDTWTTEIWFKSSVTSTQVLAAKRMSSEPGWWILTNSTGTYFSLYAAATEMIIKTTEDVLDGAWHQVVVVWDADGTGDATNASIFVDGTPASTGVPADTLAGTIVNSRDFTVGSRHAAGYPFTGEIARIRIWDSALTASQIATVYHQWRNITDFTPTPVLDWRMGLDDTYPTITDHGSGGNDGTMTDMTADDIVTVSGAVLREWEDPARPAGTLGGSDPGAPSRLNPHPGEPHKMRVVQIDEQVEIVCEVLGIIAPLDTALSSRLFTAWVVEKPATCPPLAFSSPTGQSSVQRFTPSVEGHYTIGIVREGGGSVLIHLDVEAPSV